MSLKYQDGRILHGEIASPETVVLENVGGLTESAVSEIVRNANIGEYVAKHIDEAWHANMWQLTALLGDILRFVAEENRAHRARRKGVPPQ